MSKRSATLPRAARTAGTGGGAIRLSLSNVARHVPISMQRKRFSTRGAGIRGILAKKGANGVVFRPS